MPLARTYGCLSSFSATLMGKNSVERLGWPMCGRRIFGGRQAAVLKLFVRVLSLCIWRGLSFERHARRCLPKIMIARAAESQETFKQERKPMVRVIAVVFALTIKEI